MPLLCYEEVKTFSPQELAATIVKNAQKLIPGEKRLVKYSSEFPPEVYIQNRNGARELLSGSILVPEGEK